MDKNDRNIVWEFIIGVRTTLTKKFGNVLMVKMRQIELNFIGGKCIIILNAMDIILLSNYVYAMLC